MTPRALAVAVLALVPLSAPGAPSPVPSATPAVAPPTLHAVHATGERVTLVADAGAVLSRPPLATVGGDTGGPRTADVSPVWSDAAAIGLVVDTSADAADALRDGGVAGAAGFLLQLPPRSRSGVVADRSPPVLVSAPAAGATDDLSALSSLAAGGGRDTSAALMLALRRLPARAGERSVIVLLTSSADAGGEPAAALGARLRDAGAVLAVVAIGPERSYWAAVAETTGGISVATSPATAIRAFDRVADALRTRYVVSFDGAATPATSLRWTVDGVPVVVPVTVPPEPSGAGGSSEPWWSPLTGLPALAAAGAAVVLALTVAIVVAGRRRRRRRARDPADELVPAVPSGVRVFDIRDDAPLEITDSLFEPRSVRDAREREARGRRDDRNHRHS